MRIAQGLQAPDSRPEQTTAKYFYETAYFQIINAKQLQGSYSENEVIASLHLISFAAMSGVGIDWQPFLGVACDWLAQIGLTSEDSPKVALSKMSDAGRFAVKVTLVRFHIVKSDRCGKLCSPPSAPVD
jgi:hypothetical protein